MNIKIQTEGTGFRSSASVRTAQTKRRKRVAGGWGEAVTQRGDSQSFTMSLIWEIRKLMMEHLDLHRAFPVQKPHQWPLPPSYTPYSPEGFCFSVCTNVSTQFLVYSACFRIMTGYTKHSLSVWNWHYQVGIDMHYNSSCTRGRQSKLTQCSGCGAHPDLTSFHDHLLVTSSFQCTWATATRPEALHPTALRNGKTVH